MKATRLSILLLLLTLLFGALNSLYLSHELRVFEEMTQNLPDVIEPDTLQSIRTLRERWDDRKPYFSLTIHASLLYEIDSALRILQAFCAAGETSEYASARQTLLLALERAAGLEGLSLGKIF